MVFSSKLWSFAGNADIPTVSIKFDGGLTWLVGIGQRRLGAGVPDGRRGGTAPSRSLASLMVGSARARSPWASGQLWPAGRASPTPTAPGQKVPAVPLRRAVVRAPKRALGQAPHRRARRAVRRFRCRRPANRPPRRRPRHCGRRNPPTARHRRALLELRPASRPATALPSRPQRKNRPRRRPPFRPAKAAHRSPRHLSPRRAQPRPRVPPRPIRPRRSIPPHRGGTR
jgi:hypothetical protein